MPSADSETLERVTRHLSKLIFAAHQEIEILHRIVAEATSLPLARCDDIRRQVVAEFQPSIQELDAAHGELLLEFVLRYKGPLEA
jgi:hypothetical protein